MALAVAVAGCEAALRYAEAFSALRLFDDAALDPFTRLEELADGKEGGGMRGAPPDPEAQREKERLFAAVRELLQRAATNSSPPTRDVMTPERSSRMIFKPGKIGSFTSGCTGKSGEWTEKTYRSSASAKAASCCGKLGRSMKPPRQDRTRSP